LRNGRRFASFTQQAYEKTSNNQNIFSWAAGNDFATPKHDSEINTINALSTPGTSERESPIEIAIHKKQWNFPSTSGSNIANVNGSNIVPHESLSEDDNQSR
jgi:hypothetical protein